MLRGKKLDTGKVSTIRGEIAAKGDRLTIDIYEDFCCRISEASVTVFYANRRISSAISSKVNPLNTLPGIPQTAKDAEQFSLFTWLRLEIRKCDQPTNLHGYWVGARDTWVSKKPFSKKLLTQNISSQKSQNHNSTVKCFPCLIIVFWFATPNTLQILVFT